MKHLIIIISLFGLGIVNTNAQNDLTEIEYFFNEDPGVGNANTIAIANSNSLNETFTVPIDQLPNGIHILHIRTKNNLNQWSLYARQTFYITNFSNALNNTITEAEYFFDVDPGVGNANTISIANLSSINDTFFIPIDSLPSGIHILHIRTKNNLNQWSLYARQTFYITNFSNVLNNTITEAEYFFNEDPGVGNANSIAVANLSSLNTNVSVPLDVLPTGIHILHVRVKNNFDQWSLYGRQSFYKAPAINNKEIVAAEFFIDIDPGVGNATSIALTQGESIDETVNIQIPSDLSEGDHILHIRVLDSNGTWSLYARPEFTTLSTNETVFDSFKMYPNPVNDILYFSKENQIINRLQLVDINGRVILTLPGDIEHLDLTNIASGTYLLQIETSNGSASKKIIKK